jgi:superoxide dismutase
MDIEGFGVSVAAQLVDKKVVCSIADIYTLTPERLQELDSFGPKKAVNLIKAHYGSIAAWEHDFRLTGTSLAGGSGWVILNYDPHDNAVHNHWAWDHTHCLAGGVPLLVMDMYEHAYHLDYGANARGYVDAFLQNLNWDEVHRRAEEARARS